MRLLLVLPLAFGAAAQTLPDGPGKAIVQRMCTGCHGLENVVSARMTKERWGAVVDDMVSRGATGTDDEIEQVINYLAANFSKSAANKVNVNKASPSELSAALGIPSADAAAIVAWRTGKGAFRDLRDIERVPGIDAKKIEAAKDRIEF